MRLHLIALVCVLFMSGCEKALPQAGVPLHGAVSDGGIVLGLIPNGSKVWKLSDKQLKICGEWLKEHAAGWSMLFDSPPMPSYSVWLEHENGEQSQIHFYPALPAWSTVVEVRRVDREGKFVLRLRRHLSETQIQAFRTALLES